MKKKKRKIEYQERFHPGNERMKYGYKIHIARVHGKDQKTIISTLRHIRDYEIFTNFESFSGYNGEKADRYINYMFDEGLSLSYINSNLRALREFFRWLERQKGYKRKINYNHIDYLNISNNQRRMAKATEYKKAYSFDQIIKAIRQMPESTMLERRNKAMISLQALCGLRISELRTIKLKNIIEEEGIHFIHVNPKDMEVKFAKTRNADFIQLPDDIKSNVLRWRDELIGYGFENKDPLFPIIPHNFNQRNLLEPNLTPTQIKSNTSIRDIFKKAFLAAKLPYYRPHSFRHTIARHAEKQSPEYLNAIRQSLGHSSIITTMQSYGELSEWEQRKRIAELSID